MKGQREQREDRKPDRTGEGLHRAARSLNPSHGRQTQIIIVTFLTTLQLDDATKLCKPQQ